MKIKQSNKMKPSISKAILFFGCLFAVINLYGQESALSLSSEPAQSAEGPFILKRESNAPQAQATAQPAANEKTDAPFCRHELSFWGAGGLSTLLYSPSFGDRTFGLGGAAGLGYTYYFSRNFGLLVGAELALYNAKMKVDGLTDMYGITDTDRHGTHDVDFSTTFNKYEERQRMMNVNIPIALQYQTGENHKFFASLGFKLGIPVKGSYKVSDGSEFVTTGYYHTWNQLFVSPEYLGYGTFYGDGSKKDLDFKLAYMGTAEAGVKWRLSNALSLYTGLYFEYGFNNIVDGKNNRFLAYNNANPENFTVNSTLTSQYTKDGKTESFADRVSPMAVGLKLRLGVDLCKKSKGDKKDDSPVTPPQPRPVGPQPPVTPSGSDEQDPNRGALRLSDEEIIEDLRRAVSEYGPSVRGVTSLELEGFELDQATMSLRMQRQLEAKAEEIRRIYGNDISVVVEGHTCNLGSEAHNMRLGQRRADTVRRFLIDRGGFSADKVTAVSKGPHNPLVPNTSDENRRKNRRVVLIIR